MFSEYMSEDNWKRFLNSCVLDSHFVMQKFKHKDEVLNKCQKHPTLMELLIAQFVRFNDPDCHKRILDLFGGSGTLSLAALMLGCDVIYVDNDPLQFGLFTKHAQTLERLMAYNVLREHRVPRVLLVEAARFPRISDESVSPTVSYSGGDSEHGFLPVQGFAWAAAGCLTHVAVRSVCEHDLVYEPELARSK